MIVHEKEALPLALVVSVAVTVTLLVPAVVGVPEIRPVEELIERAERRNASGEWTASPMTRAHFEEWVTIFQPPDEEEMLLFDKPVAEG